MRSEGQSREGTALRNEPSSKRQPPPTCHCEEAQPTWQSREGTSSSYKVPIKTYQPIASVAALTAQPLAALPPYGCGVPLAGSERLAGWQYSGHVFYGMRPPSLSFRGAKRRGNLLQAVALSPMAFLRSGRVLRDCHVGLRPPRNDKSGGQHCFNGGRYGSGVPSRDCHVASLLAMTNRGASTVLTAASTDRGCLPEIATSLRSSQ